MSNSNSGAGAGGAASVAEEVAGLDRLLTRLALTEDAKLEKVLSKLLPLAISRLASPHEASRKKVMEMLAHINKRVRGASAIHLPLSDLLALYCSATATTPAPSPSSTSTTTTSAPLLPAPHPLTASFALVYTDMAFQRATPEEQAAAVPVLLRGIASRAAAHQDMLLRCALQGLLRYGSPRGVGSGPEEQQLAATYSWLTSSPAAAAAAGTADAGASAAGAGAAESTKVAAAGGVSEGGEAAGGKAEAAAAAGTGGGAAGKAAAAAAAASAAPSPDMAVWLEFCLQVMLLPASLSAAAAAAANAGSAQGQGGVAAAAGLAAGGRGAAVGAGGAGAELNAAGQQGGPAQPPLSDHPGLSLAQLHRVLGPAPSSSAASPATAASPAALNLIPPDAVAQRKVAVLNFLAAVKAPAHACYLLWLVAATDSNERVNRRGEELMKRHGGAVDLESDRLVAAMMRLYQGTPASDPKQPQTAAAVPAASAAVKLRLLGAFVRSIAAANAFPGTLHVIFDAIYGVGASTRSKQLGMEFAVWVFKHAKEDRLRPLSPVILSSLLKLLSQYDAAESLNPPSQQLQAFTYRAIAQLAERCPFLVRGDASMCERMLVALEACESPSLRVVMQDALLSLASAYKGCSPKVLESVEGLLLKHCSSPVEAVRYCTLQWTMRLLSLSSAPACFLALLATADNKTEIKEAAQRFLFPEADTRTKKPTAASSPSPLSTPSPAFASSSSSSSASLSPPPSLSSLLAFICKQKPKAAAPVPLEGEQTLLLPPAAFLSAIRFLLLCWREERRGGGAKGEREGGAGEEGGGKGEVGGSGGGEKGKEKVEEKAEASAEAKAEGGAEGESVEERLCVFVEHGFARDATWEVHAEAGRALLEIMAAHPQLALRFTARLPWLQRFLSHNDPSVRAAFAKLMGVVARGLPAPDAHALLLKLQGGLANEGGKAGIKEEEAQGLIAALGYVTATAADAAGRASSVDLLLSRLLSPSSAPSTLALTAQALGLIGLIGPLPPPSSSTSSSSLKDEAAPEGTASGAVGEEGSGGDVGKSGEDGEKAASGEEEGRKKRKRGDVVEQLASLLSHRDDKVVQSAAGALGMMSYGDPQGVADAALTALLTLGRCKSEATLLAAGEALAFVWGPVDCPPFRPTLLLSGPHSSLAPIFNDADDAAAAALQDKARRPKREADVQMGDASGEAGKEETAGGQGGTGATAGAGAGEEMEREKEGQAVADVMMGEGGQETSAGEGRKEGEGSERVWGGEAMEARWESMRKVLVEELLVSSRSEERCAGAVWLMSLLSFCGHHASMQRLLPQLQDAFSALLGDSNELTQEMASRAMSRIYTLGDAGTKQLLVAALVANLTGAAGQKRSGKLLGDTEVFTEDSVARNTSSSSMRAGAAGSSSSAASSAGRAQSSVGVSTYRELCSVATDMGQPDLIYRLMDIANHHAALNSNRGAAFSFAAVAAEAGAALEPHLPALLPRLLRMMYDPNRPLAEAAGHIWRALVREPKATVDRHFDEIVNDLMGNVTGRLWRNREAACLALADLLPSRRFAEVSSHLEQVWVVSFRACDDIKDSVRVAGEKLCRAATSLTVRLCDPTLTPRADAHAACSVVLPVLLAQGMTSSVGSVRHLALSTTAKLAKGAGASVQPHLAALVPAMLEALSGLEDQNLNYAEQHAERVGISSEKLEAARLAMSRDTPMWHTLDACLQQVDESCLPDLLPTLKSLTRSSVGLNTRVGVARFISLLIPRAGPTAMRPHAPAFLKTLTLALFSERTSAGRRAFSAAAADMAKCAGGAAVEKTVGETCGKYLGEEAAGQKDVRLCCALLMRDVGKACPDDMPPCHHVLLPTLLLGRHDEDEAVRAVWEEAWDNVGVAASAAVREHAGDIAPTLTAAASSSSWTRRCQAAAAMQAVVKAMGTDTPHTVLLQFLSALLPQLPGRLWEGKEQLLPAIAAICTACPSALLSLSLQPSAATQGAPAAAAEAGKSAAADVVAAVLAACGRNKAAFRLAALQSLHKVLHAFSPTPPPKQQLSKPSASPAPPAAAASAPALDLLPLVAPGLIALFPPASPTTAPADASKTASAVEPTGEARATTAEQQEALLACVSAALLSATPTSLPLYTTPLQSALCGLLSSNPVWTVKLAVLNTSATFLPALLKLPSDAAVHNTVAPFLPSFIDALSDTKRSQTRQAAVEAVQAATVCLQHHSALEPADRDSLTAALRDAVKVEKSEAVKMAAEKCLELLGGMVE
ncbi:unnamed protein product [Closterium sp. Naga37s-1]|nr:unnamed protein product [Closterium sp. Naga37s-1]